MVASATAAVLAHPDPGALDPDRPFKDLGIDSLTALELRNSLTRTNRADPARDPGLRPPHPHRDRPHLSRPAHRHRPALPRRVARGGGADR